ncbi:aromatic amino acid transaminase [Amphibiibacter pelophylacis]|uniref:Amino acid aminotransferase n=1 Tax=Amphibiibacter pelophylacis TaxID=1799477 RepID=A0ACC6P361_9BURK
MFEHVPAFAGDPILSLMETYKADPRPEKVNLGIGIYSDDDGRLPVLDSVLAAQQQAIAQQKGKPYLPMEGDAQYRAEVLRLVLGDGHADLTSGRVATVQTLGSSGGLKLGGEFIRRWGSGRIDVSDPTWENHVSLFGDVGLAIAAYPYYDAATQGLRFDNLLAHMNTLPSGAAVLLHACCHNPTGVDLTPAQWDALIATMQARGLLPFLDMAYLGFGDGLDADAYAVRALAASGMTFFLSLSFSKNMSVYGERCGALMVFCANPEEAGRVLGQLKFLVRTQYSSPPLHGGQLVAQVLSDPALRAQWVGELQAMCERMQAMRLALARELQAIWTEDGTQNGGGRSIDFLLQQKGMFSYTGLSAGQADRLREEFGIYVLRSGRLCVAGLTTRNVAYVARALATVWA